MRIGLTFDLRDDYRHLGLDEEATAEFDSPDTIEAIEQAIAELGHEPVRIGGVQPLARRLVGGERWDLVFNIAEGLHGFGRESQVPALLDAFSVPYTFSDPLVLAVALHKGVTKSVARSLGVDTADFVVVREEVECEAVDLPLPLFVKPVAEGTSKGIGARSVVTQRQDLTDVCRELIERFRQPVLVERFLPGREFTVGMLGSGRDARPLGVMEVLLQSNAEAGAYSYANKADYQSRVRYGLASDAAASCAQEMAVAVWRGLGCRDAGRVDFRCDERGAPFFLEVNPLAGLHPRDSDLVILARLLGIGYRDLISEILESAVTRVADEREFGTTLHFSAGI